MILLSTDMLVMLISSSQDMPYYLFENECDVVWLQLLVRGGSLIYVYTM